MTVDDGAVGGGVFDDAAVGVVVAEVVAEVCVLVGVVVVVGVEVGCAGVGWVVVGVGVGVGVDGCVLVVVVGGTDDGVAEVAALDGGNWRGATSTRCFPPLNA